MAAVMLSKAKHIWFTTRITNDQRLIRLLPLARPRGLPFHVAAPRLAPFSATLSVIFVRWLLALAVTWPACSALSAPQASRTAESSDSLTVVIDAGHGGHDRGGIPGQRIAEKDMTLDVAQRLRNVLSASGYRVVMTRDSDVFVPLPTRVAIANSYHNAIFVCIHFNATQRQAAGGIETYFFSRNSLPLASAIHNYVVGGAPSSNRGVRRRGYYVLRKTSIPAVLVECGFLTNPTEGAYAQSASYREKLAEEIAAGVRGRNSVGSDSFIDQTKVARSERHSSKRSHKKSARKKKNSSKSSNSEARAGSKDPEG